MQLRCIWTLWNNCRNTNLKTNLTSEVNLRGYLRRLSDNMEVRMMLLRRLREMLANLFSVNLLESLTKSNCKRCKIMNKSWNNAESYTMIIIYQWLAFLRGWKLSILDCRRSSKKTLLIQRLLLTIINKGRDIRSFIREQEMTFRIYW